MITEFLNSKGFMGFEGNCSDIKEQIEDLIGLSKEGNLLAMEIGFNAGHSAEVFLKNNSTLKLTSFDLGYWNYVYSAKEYIDKTYPDRQVLILGDSRITIPKFIKENPDIKFDLIFIDGGHDYEVAKSDFENCRKLAHKDTIVILDDTAYTPGWEASYTIGPTKVWLEALEKNEIIELGRRD